MSVENEQPKDGPAILDARGMGMLSTAIKILQRLYYEYDFNYVLGLTVLDPVTAMPRSTNCIYSPNMHFNAIRAIKLQVETVQEEVEQLPALLRTGHIIARCINDTQRPAGDGDWIQRGEDYIVDSMQPIPSRGIYLLKLRNMTPIPPFQGYRSDRFEIIFPSKFLS